MNSDRQSRLPDYVGKKIVEALKQDNNEDLQANFNKWLKRNEIRE